MKHLTIAAMLLAASPASALSCIEPDPLRTFREAQASPDSYLVLHGRLDLDASLMPSGDLTGEEPPPDSVPAKFEGLGLDAGGFTRPVAAAITVQPTCAGPWCGSLSPGTWLLFAQVTDGGYEVEAGACGGWAFPDPDRATLDALAACMRGGACGAS